MPNSRTKKTLANERKRTKPQAARVRLRRRPNFIRCQVRAALFSRFMFFSILCEFKAAKGEAEAEAEETLKEAWQLCACISFGQQQQESKARVVGSQENHSSGSSEQARAKLIFLVR